MGCSICSYLECAFEASHSEYIRDCSATIYRISSKFAAYDLVEMERARSELETHREACVSAVAGAAARHSVALVKQTFIQKMAAAMRPQSLRG